MRQPLRPLLVTLALLALLAVTRSGLEAAWQSEAGTPAAGASLAVLARGAPDADAVASGTVAPDHDDEHGHDHHHEAGHDLPTGASGTPAAGEPFAPALHVDGPEGDHAHGTAPEEEEGEISHGLLVVLEHLGLRELAANLLWIQMDADSHHGLWHRVDFALDMIVALDPHFVEAYLLQAWQLDRFGGEHERSRRILETGVRHNPMRAELWLQLGLQCLSYRAQHGPTRHLPRALQCFSTACLLPDPPGNAFRLRAITLTCLDRRDEAIAFLAAVASHPARTDYDRAEDAALIARLRAGATW